MNHTGNSYPPGCAWCYDHTAFGKSCVHDDAHDVRILTSAFHYSKEGRLNFLKTRHLGGRLLKLFTAPSLWNGQLLGIPFEFVTVVFGMI